MHLVKTILNDELFRKKIVQTNKDQEIYNSETGFTVSIGNGNEYFIGNITTPQNDGLIAFNRNMTYDMQELFNFFWILTHGNSLGYPSAEDLMNIYQRRVSLKLIEEIKAYPMSGILTYNKNKNEHNLLLVQETEGPINRENQIEKFANDYEDLINTESNHKKIIDYISDSKLFRCANVIIFEKETKIINENIIPYFNPRFFLEEKKRLY